MSSLLFQELDNDSAELSGLFETHQMAHITNHHAASSRYTRFNSACMRLNVWNVSIANQQQGWDVNLSQPRQCRLYRKFQFWMCEVLRIGEENVSQLQLGGDRRASASARYN